MPYYDAKEVIKTFVMVTDEEENADGKIADGSAMRFFELFMKYRAEVYPAKLVFISFLSHQHAQGEMYSRFVNANVPDVLQVSDQSSLTIRLYRMLFLLVQIQSRTT